MATRTTSARHPSTAAATAAARSAVARYGRAAPAAPVIWNRPTWAPGHSAITTPAIWVPCPGPNTRARAASSSPGRPTRNGPSARAGSAARSSKDTSITATRTASPAISNRGSGWGRTGGGGGAVAGGPGANALV